MQTLEKLTLAYLALQDKYEQLQDERGTLSFLLEIAKSGLSEFESTTSHSVAVKKNTHPDTSTHQRVVIMLRNKHGEWIKERIFGKGKSFEVTRTLKTAKQFNTLDEVRFFLGVYPLSKVNISYHIANTLQLTSKPIKIVIMSDSEELPF